MKGARIPHQLQKEEFGFVKLKPRTKIPFEQDWQNKPYSSIEIQAWIDEGGNYGVLGGHGGLVILDADTEEISILVKNRLPSTFTVKSNRGYHFYYFSDLEKKIVLKKGDVHYGEIISKGSQVVAPGSVHPDSGNLYDVVSDVDIAKVTKESLFEAFSGYLNLPKTERTKYREHFDEIVNLYGEPFYLNDEGAVTSLNQSFWAGTEYGGAY